MGCSAATRLPTHPTNGDVNPETTPELFVTCETNFPLLSLRWGDGDNEKAAETASAFLDVPSVTPQVIIDKATGVLFPR